MPARLQRLIARLFAPETPPSAGTGALASGATDGLPRRVCIINFTGERANWGCRATSWELVRLLNRHWPSQTPFALDVIPLLPHHVLDRDIPARHGEALRAALGNPSPDTEQIALVEDLTRQRYLHYVDRIADADLVIFQGEGTMTGTDFLRAERLLLLPWLAKHRFGKRVISLNQTLFSAHAGFTRLLLTLLAALDQVWVREPASLDWLESNGIEGARLVPDTAFLTDPQEHGDLWQTLPDRPFFCVTGSAALTEEAIEPYLDAVHAIAEGTGLFPVFICSAGLDLKLPRVARDRWGADALGVVAPGLIYQAVAELLGRARFLIGGRYHMSILAAIGGTPSVMVATNTHKLAGLTRLLNVDWAIHGFDDAAPLIADAGALAHWTDDSRETLARHVAGLRAALVDDYAGWIHPGGKIQWRDAPPPAAPAEPVSHYAETNRRIAERFQYPEQDTPSAKLGPPQPILRQLLALTVYLRRNGQTSATFLSFRQLIEGHLDLALDQLDSRWLISICDSYADFGDPITARNALLISTFLNWERLAASYIQWAEPLRTTRRVDNPAPPSNAPLWDGLVTVQLARGDTTNNLLIRYARLLEETPHLLRIWRALLERIRNNDSVLAAMNAPHGHMFDEDLAWMDSEQYRDVPPWRKGPRPRSSVEDGASRHPV